MALVADLGHRHSVLVGVVQFGVLPHLLTLQKGTKVFRLNLHRPNERMDTTHMYDTHPRNTAQK